MESSLHYAPVCGSIWLCTDNLTRQQAAGSSGLTAPSEILFYALSDICLSAPKNRFDILS
jgi:hypothetical protein